MQAAMKLVLSGELAKEANSEAIKVVVNYTFPMMIIMLDLANITHSYVYMYICALMINVCMYVMCVYACLIFFLLLGNLF